MSAPAETEKVTVNPVLKKTKQTKLGKLLDLRRHTDHKVTGVTYIVAFTLTIYYMLTDLDWYETNILLHCLTPLAGVIVNLSALRNFRFLAKSAENPGMFAKNRTFSYAFLVENLWFQVLLGFSLFAAHPLSREYISPPAQTFFIFSMFVLREAVPKTSYTSWEVGNNKVNSKFNGWVTFINAQVKIVRWNYVFKKTYLLYLFVLFQAEYFLGVGQGAFVPQQDRLLYYLLSLDAMHNITTAFFLQTLKFKGFISAELFAVLFNASPIIGVYLTYRLLMIHNVILPYLLATFFDLYVNLEFIYPSKLSFEWKNRCQVLCKSLAVLAATGYMAYTKV